MIGAAASSGRYYWLAYAPNGIKHEAGFETWPEAFDYAYTHATGDGTVTRHPHRHDWAYVLLAGAIGLGIILAAFTAAAAITLALNGAI